MSRVLGHRVNRHESFVVEDLWSERTERCQHPSAGQTVARHLPSGVTARENEVWEVFGTNPCDLYKFDVEIVNETNPSASVALSPDDDLLASLRCGIRGWRVASRVAELEIAQKILPGLSSVLDLLLPVLRPRGERFDKVPAYRRLSSVHECLRGVLFFR